MSQQPTNTTPAGTAANERRFMVQRIYIKDMSFEAPGSGEQFRPGLDPETKMELKTETQKLSDELYEVTLKIKVTAAHKNSKAVIYQVEVRQAGLFVIRNLAEQDFTHALNASCPGILFPYARQAISGMVERGAFPQVALAPMNFEVLHQLYLKQSQQNATAPAEAQQ